MINNCNCSKCGQTDWKSFVLDCSHHLCLKCLSNEMDRLQSCAQLHDEFQFVCLQCSGISIISVIAAYKILKENRHKEKAGEQFREKILVCLDCMDQCFTLEQFLAGKHSQHDVKSIDKAYPLFSTLCQQLSEQLQEGTDLFYKKSDNICQQKKILNDIYSANMIKIKIVFENLKETLLMKEREVTDQYELLALKEFQFLDNKLDSLKENLEKSKSYLQWIDRNFISQEINQNLKFRAMWKSIQFYLENQSKLRDFIFNQIENNQNQIKYNGVQIFKEMKIQTQQSKQIVDSIRKLDLISEAAINLKRSPTLPIFQKIQSNCSQKVETNYFQRKKQQIFNRQSQTDVPSKPKNQNNRFLSEKESKISRVSQKWQQFRQNINLSSSYSSCYKRTFGIKGTGYD